MEFLLAAGVAFGAIFIAEFGDKSQLLVLAFATRYRAGPVIAGVVLAAALIQGISVAVGAAAGGVAARALRRDRGGPRVPGGRRVDAAR